MPTIVETTKLERHVCLVDNNVNGEKGRGRGRVEEEEGGTRKVKEQHLRMACGK